MAWGHRRALLASTSGLIAALGAQGVWAQTEPAGRITTPLDEITVTATKEGERAVDALASVSVVTRTEIRQQQQQRMGSYLQQLPGVDTNENARDPGTAINIRGLQDFGRVAVTVDGARQNFQTSGHNANGVFYLDPAFVRSIDITRGPVANVYGSGAIGGVVSFETLNPSDLLLPNEKFAGELGGTGIFGRQGGYYTSALMALRASPLVETLVGATYKRTFDYTDGGGVKVRDSGQELKSAIGKIVINPAEGHQLKIGGQYQNYQYDSFGTASASTIRRSADVTTTNLFARYTFSKPDNPWVNLSATAYITSTESLQARLTGTAATIGQRRSFAITTSGFDINNTSKFNLGGGATLSLTYGADYFQDRVNTADGAGSANKFTPSGRRAVYGGFVQGHLKWSMIDVIGALRYDGYELAGGAVASDGQRFSPKITVGVTPLPGIQFYGTYAEGYRAPAVTEVLISDFHPAPANFEFIPNPNLRPEVGKTLEAGVNIKFDDLFMQGDKLRGKFTVFQNRVNDFIDQMQVLGPLCGAPVPGACAGSFVTYVNRPDARIYGAEAEMLYDARRWFLGASGSYARGDGINPANGLRQPLASVYPAKLTVNGGMRFFDEKLLLGARVSFVAAQTRVPTGTTPSKEFALVDLYGAYQFTPDTRAFVQVDNVGDVRYRRYRDVENSPGIVAKVGFSTRFGS